MTEGQELSDFVKRGSRVGSGSGQLTEGEAVTVLIGQADSRPKTPAPTIRMEEGARGSGWSLMVGDED